MAVLEISPNCKFKHDVKVDGLIDFAFIPQSRNRFFSNVKFIAPDIENMESRESILCASLTISEDVLSLDKILHKNMVFLYELTIRLMPDWSAVDDDDFLSYNNLGDSTLESRKDIFDLIKQEYGDSVRFIGSYFDEEWFCLKFVRRKI